VAPTRDTKTIVGLKLWVAYLLLLLGVVLFRLGARIDFETWARPLDNLRFLPWAAISDACLTTLLVSTIFEGWIRRENTRDLHETMFSPNIVRNYLSKEKVLTVVEAGFQNLLDNDEFGSQLFSYFIDSAFTANQRRYDAHVTIMLLPLGTGNTYAYTDEQKVHYYNARMVYVYRREISGDLMEFHSTPDLTEYQQSYRNPAIEFRWHTPPMRLFQGTEKEFFEVLECKIEGEPQEIHSRTKEGSSTVSYFVRTSQHRMVGKIKKVEYVVDVKVQRFSHCLYIATREPTLRYKLSLDFSDVDISFVTAYPSYASPRSPEVRYLPTKEQASRVEIEVDTWCIPDSATLFAWVLEREGDPTYRTDTADIRPPSLSRKQSADV
jgi:hypothetical protein